MLRVRVDRHRCIGAGNCITLAPTAFDWVADDLYKVEVLDPDSVEEEMLRAAVLSCPTHAIELEDVDELLPWQLRRRTEPPRRVMKTFMFTDIVDSTRLVSVIGDDAWTTLLRWHDATLRELFATHQGEEVVTTGDGFFVGFDSPEAAIACAVAIQRRFDEHRRRNGFAPEVRIGLHASEAAQIEGDYRGVGVHEAARLGAIAAAGQIVASRETVASDLPYAVSPPWPVQLKGLERPVDVVEILWQ
jgi:class 3 adenylate cyclase